MTFPVFKHVVKRIGWDLDDTLALGMWPSPEIGAPIPLAIAAVHHYHALGYEQWIVTSRPASHAPRIWAWVAANGLQQMIYEVRCDKPLVDVMIDDRSLKFPEGLQ